MTNYIDDSEEGGWGMEECQHENIEYYSVSDTTHSKSSNVVGYCIDCGSPIQKDTNIKKCEHPTIKEDINGLTVCAVCFMEMAEKISFEPEWRSYADASTGAPKDRSRCHRQRSTAPKGIATFLESKNVKLDEATVLRLEGMYKNIVSGSEAKDQGRQGLIAALLYFDFWNTGNARTSENVRELVGVTKKAISTGITRVHEKFPDYRKRYITPIDLLNWLMGVCGIEETRRPAIREFTELVTNTYVSFKKGTPQAVASAIIYLYMCLNPEYKSKLGMNKTKFSEKTQIPDNIITKILVEFADETGFKIEL